MAEEKGSLLSRWKNHRSKLAASEAFPLKTLDQEAARVLSTGQARLLYLQELYGDNPFYHYADLYEFTGNIDVDRLIDSFQLVVLNHDILRTTFDTKGGMVQQVIHKDRPCPVKVFPNGLEENRIEEEARTFARKPFDLREGPLVSLAVFPGLGACRVLVAMHHIVVDKWSMNILRKEWAAHYAGTYSSELKGPYTYADYAAWERKRPRPAKALTYWKERLSGDIPVLNLPQDFPQDQLQTFSGAFSKRAFTMADSAAIAQAATALDITLYVYFLAVFRLVLYRYANQKDIWIGTPFTNRSRKSLEKIIGFFNDTLVLREGMDMDQTVGDMLLGVRQTVLEAFGNKDVTFEQVVNALEIRRDPTTNPLFRVMFLFHKKEPFPEFSPEIQVTSAPFDLGVAKFDLTMYVELVDGRLTSYLEYATDIFESDTVELIQDHLHLVARALIGDTNRKVGDVPFLTQQEQSIFADWNRAPERSPEMLNLVDQVKKVTLLHPDRKAIVHQDTSLSYAELVQHSRMVACAIQAKSDSKTCRFVGLLLGPECAILPSIIGCLGSGYGYIPLDPAYPQDRLQDMVNQAGIETIVTTASHIELGHRLTDVVIDYDSLSPQHQIELNPPKAEQAAYAIFTSGSTGRPKGVQVSYANLEASTRARLAYYESHPGVFLLMSSISFDSSVAGLFWTLWSGGTLVTKQERLEQDVGALAELIHSQRVTHTLMLPSLYDLLIRFSKEDQLTSLQHVIVAGEACPPGLVLEHFKKLPAISLHNEYGPTEATVWSSVHTLVPSDGDRNVVPIGRSISGYQLAVLNDDLREVPIG
nr:AMP-binding protein [Saprospiraceae bacterium]